MSLSKSFASGLNVLLFFPALYVCPFECMYPPVCTLMNEFLSLLTLFFRQSWHYHRYKILINLKLVLETPAFISYAPRPPPPAYHCRPLVNPPQLMSLNLTSIRCIQFLKLNMLAPSFVQAMALRRNCPKSSSHDVKPPRFITLLLFLMVISGGHIYYSANAAKVSSPPPRPPRPAPIAAATSPSPLGKSADWGQHHQQQ